ncbi:hypothetical protein RGC61_08000, partial [Helicobacter pylori]|nr:hypothetical protein [Helicobacter pylori]
YLISMVRISQKEKARKVDAITLKKMEEQAEKDTKAAFQKRSSGELQNHTDSPEFISYSKRTQNASNSDLDSTTNANALKETASKEPETSSKKEKKPKKKRRLSKKERQQQALQQEFERQISDSSKSEK